MTAGTAAAIRKFFKASHRRWLCSFPERGLLLRGRENLQCFTRVLALIAWMLVLSPGSLLASWEAPRSELRDARNVATTHTYDGNGNRLRTQQGAVTRSWTYDGANRVETATDGNGKLASTTYWPTGEVQSQSNPLHHVVWEDIDARGQVIRRSGPRADQVQRFGYLCPKQPQFRVRA